MKIKGLTLTLSVIVVLAMVGSTWGQVVRPWEATGPGTWGASCQTYWVGGHWERCSSRPCEAPNNMQATFCVTAPRAGQQCGLRRGELWRVGDMVPITWHDCWSSDQCCYTYNFVAEQGRTYFVKAQNESPFRECGPTKSQFWTGMFNCTPD